MNRLTIGSIVTTTLLLVGCGSSSSTSSDSPTPNETGSIAQKIKKGYYVDSAVEGVHFQCANKSGATDENGTFTFESNSTCTFTIGGVKLREINTSSLEDNITIVETNETVAQLLQTLDNDGNASNGIQIPKGADIIIKETLTSLDDLSQDVLEAVHDRLKTEHSNEYNGTVVDRNQTIEHLNRTKADLEERHTRTNLNVESEYRTNRNIIDGQREDENRTSHNNFSIDIENNTTMNSNMMGSVETRNSNSSQEHSGSASTRSENSQGRN